MNYAQFVQTAVAISALFMIQIGIFRVKRFAWEAIR